MRRWARHLARWACTVPLVGALLGASTIGRAETVAHSPPSVATTSPTSSSPSARSSPSGAQSPSSRPTTPGFFGVVNLNDASSDDLERLPGIGPAKARAIVEHRRARPFHKIDELTKVKGIGRKTFGKLRPYLTVVGATTLRESTR